MKTAIHVILWVSIVVLGYLLFESIMNPIRFNEEVEKRYETSIERLKEIRKLQLAYKSRKNEFAGSFDKLINFAKTDSFAIVKAIGEVPDTLTEEQALKLKLITRDTLFISIKDSLFNENYNIDSLAFIPYTKGSRFQIGAGELETGSKVKVRVFEVSVLNDTLLFDLDRQLVVNFNETRSILVGFPGLKVGSLTEANNNAGNWE